MEIEPHLALLAVVAVVVIVLVAYFASRLGIAAPILLVLVGIGVSAIPGVPEFELEPEWILAVVLPPILYSAAVNVPLLDFRRNVKAIASLSVLLVVVSAFGSGLLLYWLIPDLELAPAIALGAVISPPDAVAATSIGKRLGLPPRLVTVLEGEGLVNDATALVLLRSAIAASAGAVTFWGALGDFAYAALAGIAVGLAVGLVTVWIRSKLDQPVLTTAISLVVPFLAFIPAENLEASGVLAVVVAGLVTGHQSAKRFSAQDRISERVNWRTIQLLLENGVFLLMGFEFSAILADVEHSGLSVWGAVGIGLLATLALVVIRTLFVIPLVASLRREQRRAERNGPVLDRIEERLREADDGSSRRLDRMLRALRVRRADARFLQTEGLGWRGGAVIAWSGMRGVVTLAAAQSLPSDLPGRPQLVLVAFTVAIVTLVAQGGTLPLLIRVLRISGSDAQADRRELAMLLSEVGETARASLGDEIPARDRALADEILAESERIESELAAELTDEDPEPHRRRHELRRRLLEAQQAALLDARAGGAYSSRVLERAQILLDLEASRLEPGGGH